ncbi:MAG: hypothetical protein K8I03_13720 [Ignavibacteria bacterium]|nr:hypothetical protein [Ignavibacteria bacterium]
MKIPNFLKFCTIAAILALQACSSFNYKTYDEKQNENIDDPDPNYELTLDPGFQDFTSFMFIGNRIENFSAYFNTYFNANENFDDAYTDYVTRVLANYNVRQDSIFAKPVLSPESIDKFNVTIEKSSKVIQYHKSSEFLDRAVLLVGKSYYLLGDYLKAERKFGEFISKLKSSRYLDEALLYLAKTQLRLDNEKPAIERLNELIKTSKDQQVVSESYQSIAEYYLNKKNNENAIKYFKDAIKYSGDKEFKAQMQFLVASVTAKSNPKQAAFEFEKVLDYGASFDLEYLTKFNLANNLILGGSFPKASAYIEDMNVKYKDNVPYLGQIAYLRGFYFEEKKDLNKAINQYYEVIKNYPSTVPSADASFRIGNYFENNKHDYLNALRFYRFSTEQSPIGTFSRNSSAKMNILKRYFELRSVIAGKTIDTGYDIEFRKKTSLTPEEFDPNSYPPKNDDEGKGKNGGQTAFNPLDSVKSGVNEDGTVKNGSIMDSINTDGSYKDTSEVIYVDSAAIKEKDIAASKFELAELFLYDLNRADSSEYYLLDALDESIDYEFTAKVLFALSALYRKLESNAKSDDILNRIVKDYPLSEVANSSRRLLNISVVDEINKDGSDSLFNFAEERFIGKDYVLALDGFKGLLSAYPSSVHKDKALFGLGWIYENVLFKNDSAYLYYSTLMKNSPNSEAAAMVMQKVEEYETFNKLPLNVDTSGVKTDTNATNSNDGNVIDPQQLLKELEETEKNKSVENENVKEPLNPSEEEMKIKSEEEKGSTDVKSNEDELPVDPPKGNDE